VSASANASNALHGETADIAGKAVGVSGTSIDRAVFVMKAAPETFAEVDRGKLTVTAAVAKIKDAATPPGKRQQIIENAAKRRMTAAAVVLCTISFRPSKGGAPSLLFP
jgi:hypothetical protein